MRDGKPIDYEREGRISKNTETNALHIKKATVDDSNRYTCVAENGLDSDEATASLTVKGKLNSHCQVSYMSGEIKICLLNIM